MNKFDKFFFKKYVPEGQEILGIVHEHFIVIFDRIAVWLSLGVIVPSVLFFLSERIRETIPFFGLEIWLIFVFLKLMYDIFNRYNDVWIITNSAVIDLDWELFGSDTVSVKFSSIEGLEVEQDGFVDTMLGKGNLVVHKIGSDNFILENANNPYDAVNTIERISEGNLGSDCDYDEEPKNIENFDLVMEALSGVVEEYLEKKGMKDKVNEDVQEIIEKASEKHGTIDLR